MMVELKFVNIATNLILVTLFMLLMYRYFSMSSM